MGNGTGRGFQLMESLGHEEGGVAYLILMLRISDDAEITLDIRVGGFWLCYRS
jgi:hypothetical protein